MAYPDENGNQRKIDEKISSAMRTEQSFSRWVGRIALTLVVLFVSAWLLWLGPPNFLYPTYEHRYRLTIEVKVDDKIHRGSGVIQTSALAKPKQRFEQSPGGRIKLSGDAVYIDIGGGKTLFAILAHGAKGNEGSLMSQLAIKVFDPPKCKGGYCFHEIAKMSGKRAVPVTHLPTLVTFTDVKDPKTAEVVFATERDKRSRGRLRNIAVDRFDELFGGKVRLHKAWIELTKDSITRGIEKKLPWFGKTPRTELTALRRMSKRFRYTPVYGHFRIGE